MILVPSTINCQFYIRYIRYLFAQHIYRIFASMFLLFSPASCGDTRLVLVVKFVVFVILLLPNCCQNCSIAAATEYLHWFLASFFWLLFYFSSVRSCNKCFKCLFNFVSNVFMTNLLQISERENCAKGATTMCHSKAATACCDGPKYKLIIP